MNSCEFLLNADVAGDCTNLPVGGYENEAVLLNYKDVLGYTSELSAPRGQFSGIQRKVGTKGFAVVVNGSTPFAGTAKAGVAKPSGVSVQKTVKFMFADTGLTADNIVDVLNNGRFVIVMKRMYAGSEGKSKYEIIGQQYPLKFEATANDLTSEDTEGAWDITLTSTERNAGNYLWLTDEATTQALFEGLKTEVPEP